MARTCLDFDMTEETEQHFINGLQPDEICAPGDLVPIQPADAASCGLPFTNRRFHSTSMQVVHIHVDLHDGREMTAAQRLAGSTISIWSSHRFFPCIYCGNLISAEESLACEHLECPACGHSNFVRHKNPGDALREAADRHTDIQEEQQDWTGESNKEIAKKLLTRSLRKEELDRQGFKLLLSPLLPRFDDLTLLALSLAFLLLVFVNAEPRRYLFKAFSGGFGIRLAALLLFAGFGMVCSLANVFLQREKSKFEKMTMLIFAVLVTGGTGIYVGWLMLSRSKGWLMIFPAWNIFNGGMLLLLTRIRIIDIDCIIDRKVTFVQVLITAIAIPILLTICLYIFELHWATNFSIVTAYTMNIHKALSRLVNISN